MGSESITVMTLDMQLYDLAMKLWVERENIRNHFLFRPGELHIVFWALSALGKYIEGSGIDQAWVEAGLYSPTTVTNILNGKQMYRSLFSSSHITSSGQLKNSIANIKPKYFFLN